MFNAHDLFLLLQCTLEQVDVNSIAVLQRESVTLRAASRSAGRL